jgi:methylated-DNA-[protein]-cysteine S-methyltransferase
MSEKSQRLSSIAERIANCGIAMNAAVAEFSTGVKMESVLHLWMEWIETPIGEMAIVSDGEGNLRATIWRERDRRLEETLQLQYGKNGFTLEKSGKRNGLAEAVRRYFAGELRVIDTLPVQMAGTEFQREVWGALREIPCGTTVSYMELARRIGRPKAVRAVGLANGSNPVGVVVPCHRVIGADGSLTGYGGGIERKRWLLEHEGALSCREVKQRALF